MNDEPNKAKAEIRARMRALLTAMDEKQRHTASSSACAKVASLEAGAGLPPVIPEGMRAISVRVNEVIGVAGFVVPGSLVDVLVTVRTNTGTNDEPMTRTVVSKVMVLTAGTRYDQEKSKDDNITRVLGLVETSLKLAADAASRQRIPVTVEKDPKRVPKK